MQELMCGPQSPAAKAGQAGRDVEPALRIERLAVRLAEKQRDQGRHHQQPHRPTHDHPVAGGYRRWPGKGGGSGEWLSHGRDSESSFHIGIVEDD